MVRDAVDEQTELLRVIAQQLGAVEQAAASGGGTSNEQRNSPQTPNTGTKGVLDPQSYRIHETNGLHDANDDGTVTIEPNQRETVLSIEDGPIALLAIGATDRAGATYEIYADNTAVVGGSHTSPLGSINSPFSFVDALGGAIPVQSRIEYRVRNSGDTEIDVAARAHIQQL